MASAYSNTVASGNLKLRGSAGGSSRVKTFSIGDLAAQPADFLGSPAGSSTATADFSGGSVDILADSIYVGRSAADPGAGGSFNVWFRNLVLSSAAHVDVNNLYIAYKQGTNPHLLFERLQFNAAVPGDDQKQRSGDGEPECRHGLPQ